MITYRDFNKGSSKEKLILDGKHGFFMFLKLIDELKMNFLKTSHYLNTGKYQYFFTTEHIKKKEDFAGYFRDSLSLNTTCETSQDIQDKRISFYFGIKDNYLEYGFQNDMNREIYTTGKFKVDSRYVRSLKSYKCLTLIENILKNSKLNNLNILQQVKQSFKELYKGKGDILILNEDIIRKSIDKEDLKKELENVNNLLRKYEKWCEKFKWFKKVYYYIDSDDGDKVTFYVKIKPKENLEKNLESLAINENIMVNIINFYIGLFKKLVNFYEKTRIELVSKEEKEKWIKEKDEILKDIEKLKKEDPLGEEIWDDDDEISTKDLNIGTRDVKILKKIQKFIEKTSEKDFWQ